MTLDQLWCSLSSPVGRNVMPNLDDDYANGPYIPGADTFPPRWAEASATYRRDLGDRAELDVSYGPSDRMAYDLFHPASDASKGTLVFVHGGYWRAFDRKSWSHLAAGANARGWAVAMPSYDLCPSVGIAMITQQIAQAVTHIAVRQPGPIALAGHSAGGHLVARMCASGMLPKTVLKRVPRVMPISPLSDLEPLIQTAMNDDFKLDAPMARAESPKYQPKPIVPVTVWVGAEERPAFLEQAALLVAAWEAEHVIAPDKHHFDVIEPLADPDSDMINRLSG